MSVDYFQNDYMHVGKQKSHFPYLNKTLIGMTHSIFFVLKGNQESKCSCRNLFGLILICLKTDCYFKLMLINFNAVSVTHDSAVRK